MKERIFKNIFYYKDTKHAFHDKCSRNTVDSKFNTLNNIKLSILSILMIYEVQVSKALSFIFSSPIVIKNACSLRPKYKKKFQWFKNPPYFIWHLLPLREIRIKKVRLISIFHIHTLTHYTVISLLNKCLIMA